MLRNLGRGGALALALAGALALPARAAEPVQTVHIISVDLAAEAALAAVHACAGQGYRVSAVVVEPSGLMKAFAKADGAAPHTKDSALGKAYTVVSLGLARGDETSAEIAQRLQSTPGSAALANIPGILPLPGAVVIRAKGEVVGAIGVGGAPGGDKDEGCARAGIDKIKDRLPQ